MVDTDTRGNGSGESEPFAPSLGPGSPRQHFADGVIHSRDWQAMLGNGVVLPSPGAPVPVAYPGGSSLPDPRPGVPAASGGAGPVPSTAVVSGMHQDPRAAEYNIAGDPGAAGGFVSKRNQGAGRGRLSLFGAGQGS